MTQNDAIDVNITQFVMALDSIMQHNDRGRHFSIAL